MTFVIGVDFNGVIADHSIKARAIKARTGVDIPLEQLGTKGQMIGSYGRFGLTLDGYEDAMKYAFEDPRRFRELAELVPEAKEALLRLAGAGHEIHVVSSCRGLSEAWTRTFLAEHEIPIAGFVAVQGNKSDMYALCHIVIDDEVKHLSRSFLNENPNVVPILMLPSPGGTGCEIRKEPKYLHPRVCVAKGWGEVLTFIPELETLAA